MPRAVRPAPAFVISDRVVEDGSYLRLKNVTLGYELPASVTRSVGVPAGRVYVSGDNLWTWTDFSGYDPEVSRFGQNSLAQGVDYGGYPMSRTLRVGLNIDL